MKEIFMFFITNMVKLGKLESAHFYDDEFAQIEISSGKKLYSLSIRCTDLKESENDGN